MSRQLKAESPGAAPSKEDNKKKFNQVQDLFNKICKKNPNKLLEVEKILLR